MKKLILMMIMLVGSICFAKDFSLFNLKIGMEKSEVIQKLGERKESEYKGEYLIMNPQLEFAGYPIKYVTLIYEHDVLAVITVVFDCNLTENEMNKLDIYLNDNYQFAENNIFYEIACFMFRVEKI